MTLRDVALLLGPVGFAGFEVPETIKYGGRQRIAVHDLPGGQRVVDTLGPVPSDIAWSGIFSGPDATGRARLIDQLRVQGQAVALSWDVFSYTVIVADFAADYHNAAWVPYRLTVSVVQDNAIQLASYTADLLTEALSDVTAAAGYGATASVPLNAVQAAFAVPGATTLGTAAYVAANQNLGQAQASVQAGFASADATVGNYAQNGVSGATDVIALGAAAAAQANLSWAGLYLGRLQSNMGRAGT
jgi:hypothetical protein